ncbi:MAG: LAGLIDADG family homing endonuclease [Nanoarchaeota archaeon]
MTKLNSDICEFIGAFIGDGYLTNCKPHQYTVGITGDKLLDKEYICNYLSPLIKRSFDFTNPRIYYRNDENSILLRINSKKLSAFLIDLGFHKGPKSHDVTIPKEIFSKPHLMNHTIRGIFDTDGCVFFDKRNTYKKPYPRITLQSASIELIKQLEKYLSKHFKIYVSKSNRDGYRNCIEIYGNEQLIKFLKLIGFSNKRHLNKVMPS